MAKLEPHWWVCLMLLTGIPARVEGRPGDSWGLDVMAGTNFPLDVHARAGLELPGRILVSTSLGLMPPGYVNALNSVLLGLNVYDRDTADLIQSSLQTSLVWRSLVGWRPFARSGFHFQLGYTLITLGGGAAAAPAIAAATGRVLDEALLAGIEIEARSRLHQLSGEIGWQWWVKRLTFGVSLGGFGTLDASTRLTPRGDVRAVLLRPLTQAGEVTLNDAFRSYVHGVTLNARVGFTLF